MLEEELEQIIRGYENPEKRGYKEYYDYLRGYNAQIHKELKNFLITCYDTFLNKGCQGFIAVVGSDARLEKGEKSPLELLIIKKREDTFPRICYEIEKRRRIFEGSEIKNIQESMIYYKNNKRKLFPSRIIDAKFIFGDYNLFINSKQKMLSEISRSSKSIKKSLKERDRYYRNILNTGENEFKRKRLIHYDLKKGVSYYDEEQGILSFKAGPLRFIQNKLIREIIKKMKEDELSFALNLPANISDRIYFLYCCPDYKLGNFETEEIIDSYKYFLKQYHKSQRNLHDYNQFETDFDKQEVKERIEGVNRILTGNSLF